ncbi:MAG TPA: VOC family protein [Candidatus Sulfotelmatobacter sp.]|nr:VOC family protein [Candidatus Sulfotelmatobacter sp.]
MNEITPFLWFDDRAEEAVAFYTSVFPNSGVDNVAHYGEGGPGEAGTVMSIEFHLNGRPFVALNGGPIYTFTPAISFAIACETQAEVDRLWDRLTDGGQPVQCGWLTDKFGLSWQVVPKRFFELMDTEDADQRKRVMEAMLEMVKFDVAALERAAVNA